MDELQNTLNQLRVTVSQQAAALHAVEKKKIDRVIINQEDILEKEAKRLRKNIEENLSMANKLQEFNKRQHAELETNQQAYLEMTTGLDINVTDLLDLDIESNMTKYWQLLSRKQLLERQVDSLGLTVKQ